MFARFRTQLLTPLVLGACGMLALAQNYPPQVVPPPAYVNPYIQYNGPAGGYLTGASQVISAQGQFMNDQQRAKLTQQQVEQAKADTRRHVFDERRYELANTPTQQEERERLQALELRRVLRTPNQVEIWSGAALNTIFDNAKDKQGQGIKGPEVPLDSSVVLKLSVTNGTGGNVALFKDGDGKLEWPLPLLDSAYEGPRQELDRLVAEVVKQAKTGQFDRTLLPKIEQYTKMLRGLLADHINDMSPSDNIGSRRYLGYIDSATQAMKDPSALNYFNGTWAARGKTVDELVKNMTLQGLRFAPAAPGNESAYTVTYAALAAYDGSLVADLRPIDLRPK